MDKVLCDEWGRWRVSRESCREVLDVRGNDAARQLVPRPVGVFTSPLVSNASWPPPSLHDSDQITYSLTPPRQNSMESDRPTHIFTDTQGQRQCRTRISPLLPTLDICLRLPLSALVRAASHERVFANCNKHFSATRLFFVLICLEIQSLVLTYSNHHSHGLFGGELCG